MFVIFILSNFGLYYANLLKNFAKYLVNPLASFYLFCNNLIKTLKFVRIILNYSTQFKRIVTSEFKTKIDFL